MSITLERAISGAPVDRVEGDRTVEVVDVVHDSRAAAPGALFCCLRGTTTDGHDHAAEAVAAGAVALLVDHPVTVGVPVPQVIAPDTRAAMAPIASAVHGHPSHRLQVVGVTGTNGKTTTTMLIGHALGQMGVTTAVLGTLSGARTTPESTELQRWLAEQVGSGVTAVAIEVSSHALVQHRVDTVSFAVAVFTNLSPDHLDFHGTMDRYFGAKAELFAERYTTHAVVNVDDEHGARLARTIEQQSRLTLHTFSLDDVVDLEIHGAASSFVWRGHRVELSLGGRFNVSNALAAGEALVVLGHDASDIATALSVPVVVPGRFETVDAGQPFTVIVDFAHTPDGLEQVLRTAGEIVASPHQVRVVFGCGGDRDPAKRPLMGAVAARLADHVVVTADNSRSEPTAAIIDAIRQGLDGVQGPRVARVDVEADRRRAIDLVVGAAEPGDVVVIAGKGHETTQTIGRTVTHFDDREVARAALSHLGGWSQ